MKKAKISAEEVKQHLEWLKNNSTVNPESIHKFLVTALTILLKFLEPSKDLKIRKLLELMGIVPKSEKGSSLAKQ